MKKTLITTIAMLMLASLALANGGGRGGPGGPAFGDFGGGNLLIASDGTVFLTRTVVDTGARTATTTVTAIRSTGVTAWTITLANRDGNLVLSGTNLLSLTSTSASEGTVSSTITALSTASGAVAWTRTINGAVQDLLPFSGGTYAIVVIPATTSGGTATRSTRSDRQRRIGALDCLALIASSNRQAADSYRRLPTRDHARPSSAVVVQHGRQAVARHVLRRPGSRARAARIACRSRICRTAQPLAPHSRRADGQPLPGRVASSKKESRPCG